MSDIRIYTGTIRREQPAGKFVRFRFECFADISKLEAMAHKAACNRSMKSRMGPTQVKIIERIPE